MPWTLGDAERRRVPMSCQQEILERIHLIDTELKLQRVQQTQMHEENRSVNARIMDFIEGNGTAGAKVRLDRLEQDMGERKRKAGYTWASIVGLAVKSLWDTVTKP